MKKLFSVFDKAGMFYTSPITANHQNEALRIFECAVRAPDSDYSKFPQDYDLYYLGDYNELNGQLIQGQEHPQRLITGLEMVRRIETMEREHMGDRLAHELQEIKEEAAQAAKEAPYKNTVKSDSVFDKIVKDEEYQEKLQDHLDRQELGYGE